MKNLIQTTIAFSLMFIAVSATCSSVNPQPLNTVIKMSDNYCTLHVKTSYGSPAKSVKVSTEVSGGISCIGGRSFYTDSYGEVTLKWSSGCYLKKIYIDGKGYDVDYRSGNTYHINMN